MDLCMTPNWIFVLFTKLERKQIREEENELYMKWDLGIAFHSYIVEKKKWREIKKDIWTLREESILNSFWVCAKQHTRKTKTHEKGNNGKKETTKAKWNENRIKIKRLHRWRGSFSAINSPKNLIVFLHCHPFITNEFPFLSPLSTFAPTFHNRIWHFFQNMIILFFSLSMEEEKN